MFAVYRRELGSYFQSPIGYIFLAVFYVFAGFYFLMGALLQYIADLSQTFGSLFSVTLFLIPILTMRLLSEERKQRTDQALLTAPISLTGLVMGKFLSAVTVFVLGLSSTILFGLVCDNYAYGDDFDWVIFWGNYLALLLLGMALIAIGLFISSLTESQVIAATGGYAVGLLLLLIDAMRWVFPSPLFNTLVGALSFYDRYSSFTVGVFKLPYILFFVSVCAIFVFLTVRVFDKRRWG